MLTKAERRARILRAAEIFRRHGVTQDEVGAVVGASQPHVSRVLQANLSRATRLSEEICLYAERLEDGGVTLEAVCANDDLIEALSDLGWQFGTRAGSGIGDPIAGGPETIGLSTVAAGSRPKPPFGTRQVNGDYQSVSRHPGGSDAKSSVYISAKANFRLRFSKSGH